MWVVARDFPPINTIATERLLKFIRSFKEDYNVTIFTVDTSNVNLDALDLAREKKVLNKFDCEIVRVPVFFPEFMLPAKQRTLIAKLKKIVYSALNRFFGDTGWTMAYGLYAEFIKRKHLEPKLIFASGSPFLNFYSVWKFSTKHNVDYILDYRDLWTKNPHSSSVNIISSIITTYVENKVNKNALCITTVSKGCKEVLEKYNRCYVLYNYPDVEYVDYVKSFKTESKKADNIFKIVYTGSLYKRGGLDIIAKSVNALPEMYKNKVEFHYYGYSSSQALDVFKSCGLESIFIDHKNVSKDNVLKAIHDADLLVSLVYDTEYSPDISVRGIMSTKIFDYLISNSNIINIGPKDNELTLFLKEKKFDGVFTFNATELDAIVEHIKYLIENKMSEKSRCIDENMLWEEQFKSFKKSVLDVYET